MAEDDEDSPDGQPLWFDPQHLPVSRVESIGDSIQYASHVVNMVVPGFGRGRVEGDDNAFDLYKVTREFYEYFPDVYDSIAIVTAEQHPSSKFGAYHLNVRNPIKGLGGKGEFDYADHYGSSGALRSVELYRDARFTTVWTSNHEIGHQWIDYWDWSEIAGGIERAGWSPAGHTPLLFPGEVLLGAVLRPIRRVAPTGGDEDEEASYVIERTPAPSLYHPPRPSIAWGSSGRKRCRRWSSSRTRDSSAKTRRRRRTSVPPSKEKDGRSTSTTSWRSTGRVAARWTHHGGA